MFEILRISKAMVKTLQLALLEILVYVLSGC